MRKILLSCSVRSLYTRMAEAIPGAPVTTTRTGVYWSAVMCFNVALMGGGSSYNEYNGQQRRGWLSAAISPVGQCT